MTNSKPWYTSKTIWGTILTFVGFCATAVGMHLNPDAKESNAEAFGMIATLIGIIVSIVGRLNATKRIASDESQGGQGEKPGGHGDSGTSWTGSSLAMLLIVGGSTLLTAGCNPSADYIAADRATFEAIAPVTRGLVNGEITRDSLDQDEINDINLTLDTWELRLRGSGPSVASGQPAVSAVEPDPFE